MHGKSGVITGLFDTPTGCLACPQGAPGPYGPPGPVGPKGRDGINGYKGMKGRPIFTKSSFVSNGGALSFADTDQPPFPPASTRET